MCYSIYYPIQHFKSIKEFPEYHERHSLLFQQFKKDDQKWMLFYAFFIIRRLCLAFVIVWMKDFIKLQCILITLMSGWMLYYHAKVRPYTHIIENVLSTFNEGILVVYSILLFLFLSPDDPILLQRAGYCCILLLAVFLLVNWLVIFPFTTLQLIKSCKKKWAKKPKKQKHSDSELVGILKNPTQNVSIIENSNGKSNRSDMSQKSAPRHHLEEEEKWQGNQHFGKFNLETVYRWWTAT